MSVFNWPKLAPDLSKMREAYHRDRRESIAREVLKAMFSNEACARGSCLGMAQMAVVAADALIAELDKEVQP